MANEFFVEKMTWKDVQEAASQGRVVTIIVGSTEQHGPHLPLGTDVFVPLGIAERAAPSVGLIIAPAIAYGYYSRVRSGGGGEKFPGTTSVRSSTLVALITDVMQAFIKHGFTRFLFLGGHYENSHLVEESVENATASTGKRVRTVVVNWWEIIPREVLKDVFENDFPGWETEHGGITSTSIMMYLMPELVRTEEIRDGETIRSLNYDIIPSPDDVIPKTGVPWKATLASKRKGEILVDSAVKEVIKIVRNELLDPSL